MQKEVRRPSPSPLPYMQHSLEQSENDYYDLSLEKQFYVAVGGRDVALS